MNYYIKGTKNLIKAFTEELIELGYKHDWDNRYNKGDCISVYTQDKTYIINNNNGQVLLAGGGINVLLPSPCTKDDRSTIAEFGTSAPLAAIRMLCAA